MAANTLSSMSAFEEYLAFVSLSLLVCNDLIRQLLLRSYGDDTAIGAFQGTLSQRTEVANA